MSVGGPTSGPAREWREHPFLAEESAAWTVLGRWEADGVLLLSVRGRRSGRPAVIGVGAAEPLAALLARVTGGPTRPYPEVATLTRGTWRALASETGTALGLGPAQAWDWMVCRVAPPVLAGEADVRPVTGDHERAEAAALLAAVYPGSRLSPADPRTRWWGRRDADGRLRAVAGVSRRAPEGPVRVGGVATDAAWRGRGLGAALTAAAVRDALTDAPWVSLGVSAANTPARRLYRRLGFEPAGEFETVRRPGPA